MDTKTVSADGSFTEDMIVAANEAASSVYARAMKDSRLTPDMISVMVYAAIYAAMLKAAPEATP